MYEAVIGLEIHVQLKTKSKLFCASPNDMGSPVGRGGNDFAASAPNTNICEICTGYPGTLPRLNIEALKKTILVGLALNCQIAHSTKFDRKNYFYPDLPKGYQISQYDKPINGRGELKIGHKAYGITRAHLEEDAGKLLHSEDGKNSLVDFNRAGVPLLEIVTEPDFKTPKEAAEFLRLLRNIVRYLEVSDADMEKGHLRVDANVSVRKAGEKELPSYKVEVKNMNSFKAVEAALSFEISRQQEMLQNGEKPTSETRGFVEASKTTVSQRTKEEAHDYRYFPEPDLPQIEIPKSLIQELKSALPELPHHKAKRFVEEYGLPEADVMVLTDNKSLASYFEEAASELLEWRNGEGPHKGKSGKVIKSLSNWVTGDFLAFLNRDGLAAAESKITPENFAELVKMVEKGEISATAGKTILAEMYATGGDPGEIASDMNLGQVSDTVEIEAVVDKVLAANQDVVAKYKAGKTSVVGVLVGEVMKEMKGRANPKVVNEILVKKLSD